jgi:antitoxin component YwqK of YwqJK toxin-antitoxin module
MGCNRNDEMSEGVTRKVVMDRYDDGTEIQIETYYKDLQPFKGISYYKDGKIFSHSYYVQIDTMMEITTVAYYPTGSLRFINTNVAQIDTFLNTSVEGKTTKSIRVLRYYPVHRVELYPNGKIERRWGRNNIDSSRTFEWWFENGRRKSEVVTKYCYDQPIKNMEWDSLGHLTKNEVDKSHTSKH